MANQKKILMVEDDIFLVRVYENMLTKQQYQVDYLTDSREIANKLQEQSYDLILLDLIMPHKDGFTVLKELKADPKTSSIPVFVLSKLSSQEDVDAVMKLGAEKFLTKISNSFMDVITQIEARLQ